MKGKCFMLGVAVATVGRSVCFAAYVAEQIIHPRTGKQTVFWADASKGKDAYIVSYDEKSQKFYFEKIEKNKPSDKDESDNDRVISARNEEIEKNKPSDEDKSDNDRYISVRNEKIEKNKPSNKNKSDNDRYISARNGTLQKAR